MTDIKTGKFVSTMFVSYQEFAYLLFGLISKMEFQIRKSKSIELVNNLDLSNEIQITRIHKANELIKLWQAQYKKRELVENIESMLMDKGVKQFEVAVETSLDADENMEQYVETNIERMLYEHFFEFYCQEFETDSNLYADWIYPLLDKEVPHRPASRIKKTNLERELKLDELPPTIQLLIELWQNPKSKLEAIDFRTKDEYLEKLLHEFVMPLNREYDLVTLKDNKINPSGGFLKAHMKTIDLIINHKESTE